MNRRDFSRNVAKVGFGGALALVLGIRKAGASNYCWNTPLYPVSACQSRWRTCCNTGYCSDWNYVSNNNCAWAGKPAMCCG